MKPREADRVSQIVECERQAEEYLAQADELRWKAAELIAAELEAGKTQRKLAAEIGKSHKHVGYMSRLWSRFGNLGSQERPAFNEAYQQAKLAEASADAQRMQSSESNEWYTPVGWLDKVREVLGAIDLDPASSPVANETVRAAQFYTAEDDGLTKHWKGRVWLNPPYGGKAGPFIAKLVAHYRAGDVSEAICVVSLHSAETEWFQPLWDHWLGFTRGRIHFEDQDGSREGATHGSVFAYLGPSPGRFREVFRESCHVVRDDATAVRVDALLAERGGT